MAIEMGPTLQQLPDPGTLLYTYVREEAVLSSQIEGTQPRSRT